MANWNKQILLTGIIISFTYSFSWSQEMKAGFHLLEKGSFEKAEVFFAKVLKNYPRNKTAKICYGRATGLAGKPEEALKIFEELDHLYPNDVEILLNRSESYLWMNDSKSAILSYLHLLSMDSTLFAATLGIANSYSLDHQYEKAYQYIGKAQMLQPGNAQVQQSRKYIILGLSNQLASEKNAYKEALVLLEQNFAINPNDQESLRLKATILLISEVYPEALSVYKSLNNEVESVIGQSVIVHLMGDDKQALSFSEKNLKLIPNLDKNEKNQVYSNYISALLWNNQIKEAGIFLDSIMYDDPENKVYLLSKAQIAIYKGDFPAGIKSYDEYLNYSPTEFGANLGKADAKHALGIDDQAYQQAFKTLTYYPGQKDVNSFITSLNKAHGSFTAATVLYGSSSDGSQMNGYQLTGFVGLSPLSNMTVTYLRKVLSSESGTSSIREAISFSSAKRFNKWLKINGGLSLAKVNFNETQNDQSFQNFQLSTNLRISKSQNLTLGYLSEIQDFNEALLKQNLKTSHFSIKNSFFWKLKGLGWYTEVYRSFYSDSNSRNLIFNSLYKTIYAFKPLKFGLNHLLLNFKESRPEAYYSPIFYNQFEVFTELNFKENKNLPLGLNWNFATGYQITEGLSQLTWRTGLRASKEFGKWSMLLKCGYSTIASTQTNGFSHFSLEGQVKLLLGKKPIFYRKISKAD